MAPNKLLSILLQKNDANIPWGFSVVGGKEIGLPLIIDQVHAGTLASQHLQAGEIILKINNIECSALTTRDIEYLIHGTAKALDLLVWKNPKDMVKLIKKQDTIFESHTESQDEDIKNHDIKDTKKFEQNVSDKFNFKYPHQFLDLNKFQTQNMLHTQQLKKMNEASLRKSKLEEMNEKIVEETAQAFNNERKNKRTSRVSGQILRDNGRLFENGIKSEKTNEYNDLNKASKVTTNLMYKTESKTTSNVVYNNVNINTESCTGNQTDVHMGGYQFQNVDYRKSTNNSPKPFHKDQQLKEDTEILSTRINGHTNERLFNTTYTKDSPKAQEQYVPKEVELESPKGNEFSPLANSTLLNKPNERREANKVKEDEDDIDAQFTKYYETMIEAKQEKQKSEKRATTSPVIIKEIPFIAKSNAPLFNQNYQLKLEERRRISKSSERVLKEAKEEISQLVKKDFTNAEWSGKTEVYTSNKAPQYQPDTDVKFIDDDEDEDEPQNELKKNPMFNRLREIEEQVERCMSAERSEKENQFNKKFEEYYRATAPKSNFMKSRWNSYGKQHSEENLHTISNKPHMPRPHERLTDPRGVFFKKRYEECVLNSRNGVEEKQSPRFCSSGFNNSKKFWKEMEKNCPGEKNVSEYRTHFVKTPNQFDKESNTVDGHETKNVEQDFVRFGTESNSDIRRETKIVVDDFVKLQNQTRKEGKHDTNTFDTDFVKSQNQLNKESHKERKQDAIRVEQETKCFSPYENMVENEVIRKDIHSGLQEVQEPPCIRKHIEYDRSKTPVGFYENKKPKLKVDISNKVIEKIQSFAQTKNEDRKLRSPVAENIEKIINGTPTRRTPSNERSEETKNTPDNTFRTITPQSTRSSGGCFTPTSPFYYENLKASPIFMGMKVKVADGNDCKRCSICGEEPDYDEFEQKGDNANENGFFEEIIQAVGEKNEGDTPEPTGCCAGRSGNESPPSNIPAPPPPPPPF
uniref:PDZ and LIM domain protein Zasp n=1 Tax=Cacopsylla melanoneura TaxID=428564 RepID=A0A8D9B4C6_9HEMI